MDYAVPPSSAAEALEMLRTAMGYLAAADATAMAAETQAQCLRALEQVNSMGTAARTSILAAFTAAQGYTADADYSPRAWLIHKLRVTRGTAVAYTAWVRRRAAHPQVAAVLAAGEISESVARTICAWTDKLPEDCRAAADAILLTAARAGADLRGPGGTGRGDLRPVPAGRRGQEAGAGVRGPVGQAGDHVRGRGGADRGSDAGVRGGGGHGAGRAVRPGRARRTPGARRSGITMACRRRCVRCVFAS